MLDWFKGAFQSGEQGIPSEFQNELKKHSSLWQERLKVYIEQPPVSLTDLARNLDLLNVAVAEQCAHGFIESIHEDWMHEWKDGNQVRKPIATIRSRFLDWGRLQKFHDDERHLMWKFLCQEYFEPEVRSFVEWTRGMFEDAVLMKKMRGKLRDHPEYVEEGFEHWRKEGVGAQYILSEQEEYYCWQGVEWQLFNARDVGKRLGSEVK